LLKNCDIGKEDIQMALLMSRNTPRANIAGTPARRLFGRNTPTPLVLNEKTFIPKINKLPDKELERLREKQKYYADKEANEAKEYQRNQKVLVQDVVNKLWYTGRKLSKATDRSYIIVKVDGAIVRRNTSLIRPTSI